MLQSFLGIPEEWDFIYYGVVNKFEWMAVIKSRNEWLLLRAAQNGLLLKFVVMRRWGVLSPSRDDSML